MIASPEPGLSGYCENETLTSPLLRGRLNFALNLRTINEPSMKNLIKLEELGLFALSIFFLYKLNLNISWWLYIILFFSPDIGILGYAINNKLGAFTYNLFHHKAIACLLIGLGIFLFNDILLFAGLLMLAHSSFDRILGYGLKYSDHFKHTSIGKLD